MHWITRSFFLAVLLLGLACLNYTTDASADHHRAWAAEHDLPPPSPPLFYAGAAATVAGAMLLGLSIGRRRRA